MKISEILYDAVKYPFSGIKQLLLLGLMILTTTSILGYPNKFYTYLDFSYGDNGSILFILLIIIASFLGNLVNKSDFSRVEVSKSKSGGLFTLNFF